MNPSVCYSRCYYAEFDLESKVINGSDKNSVEWPSNMHRHLRIHLLIRDFEIPSQIRNWWNNHHATIFRCNRYGKSGSTFLIYMTVDIFLEDDSFFMLLQSVADEIKIFTIIRCKFCNLYKYQYHLWKWARLFDCGTEWNEVGFHFWLLVVKKLVLNVNPFKVTSNFENSIGRIQS